VIVSVTIRRVFIFMYPCGDANLRYCVDFPAKIPMMVEAPLVNLYNAGMADEDVLDTDYLFQPRGQGTGWCFRMLTPSALIGQTNPRTGQRRLFTPDELKALLEAAPSRPFSCRYCLALT